MESPEYTPTIACAPPESDDVVHIATPLESATALHAEIEVPSDLKLTVPVGVPELPVMRTVKVTDWPAAMLYDDESRPRLGDAEPGDDVGGGVTGGVTGGCVTGGCVTGGVAVPPELFEAARPKSIAPAPASAAPTSGAAPTNWSLKFGMRTPAS